MTAASATAPDAGAAALAGWDDEMRSAYLYRVVARAEAGGKQAARARMFEQLASEAESQAAQWAAQARAAGLTVPGRYQPDRRARIVAHMVRRIGPRAMRGVLAAMKVRGLSIYTEPTPGQPVAPGNALAEPHSGASGSGTLRAAVFGVNDGLVSNCSLIMGVAGANAEPKLILLSGVAGLLAGAFSMAAGEYVSMRSQREMFEYQIGLEKKELALYPQEEAEELALIYVARGMSEEDAKHLAERTIADPVRALDTLAREELGLNPDELGSPWGAAIYSFLSFAGGALVPLMPFLVTRGDGALYSSIALTGIALFAVGAAISLFTGRSALASGLRMLGIGAGAGALTYAIGHVLGVSLS